MNSFPASFSDFVNRQRYLSAQTSSSLRQAGRRFTWFPLLVRPSFVGAAIDLLDRHISPFLKPSQSPIPRTTITEMEVNYSEALPKTIHNLTVSLNHRRSTAYAAAERIGLPQMLGSSSLRQFAEQISGFSLKEAGGQQVILYRTGDYTGPHNDHHPEEPHLRQGYVDLQITLTNKAVERQIFIHEAGGYFNQATNVAIPSGVSVSILPFWHQATPLQAKPGFEQEARRWLLLVSFEIKRKSRSQRTVS